MAASVAFYFASVLGQLLLSVHRVSLTPAMLVMFHLGVILFWQVMNLFPVRGIGYISTVAGKQLFLGTLQWLFLQID